MEAGVWMEVREDEDERKYSTWYKSGSDTKIKKEENNYLCNDKMSHSMILSCIYTVSYTHLTLPTIYSV